MRAFHVQEMIRQAYCTCGNTGLRNSMLDYRYKKSTESSINVE